MASGQLSAAQRRRGRRLRAMLRHEQQSIAMALAAAAKMLANSGLRRRRATRSAREARAKDKYHGMVENVVDSRASFVSCSSLDQRRNVRESSVGSEPGLDSRSAAISINTTTQESVGRTVSAGPSESLARFGNSA